MTADGCPAGKWRSWPQAQASALQSATPGRLQPTLRRNPAPATRGCESCLMQPQVWGKEQPNSSEAQTAAGGCRRWGGPGALGVGGHSPSTLEIQLPGVYPRRCWTPRSGMSPAWEVWMAAGGQSPRAPHRAGPPHPGPGHPGSGLPSATVQVHGFSH